MVNGMAQRSHTDSEGGPMKALSVVLVVLSLAMSASAEEKIGPNEVAEAVAADVTPAPVAAQVVEATPETNLSEGVVVIDVPFYWNGLCDAIVSLIGVGWKAIFIFGVGWLIRKLAGKEVAQQVQQAIAVGVDHSWEEMGRELKHAAKDRKLTADERAKLRNKAIEHAKSILGTAGRKLLEGYSWSTVIEKISAAVQKRKAIAAMSKGKTRAVSGDGA
jgi:hypothetical protein